MNLPNTSQVQTQSPPLEENVEVIAKLEELDDILFPAIAGDQKALAEAEPAWKTALESLGPETVQETRGEYLRYARSTWEFLVRETILQPERILAVIKIILLLTSDDGS